MGLVDNTLFTKKRNSHIIIVQIYVDDIIFGSTCQELCDDFSKIMHNEFEMSMMGELNFFLGLQIKQFDDGIFFNQSKYVKEMLKKFGLEDSKPIKTPMSSETKLTRDEDGEPINDTKYRGMIGSLLYLMASHPDIIFSVCLCARFQEAPKTTHLEAVKRIFRYIKGTSHLGLWYPKGTGLETIVYADSDHAGDYVDRKSTSGVCTFVGCCLTSWFSKKQTALAISTTEAEYVSAEKACQQALWMKQALVDYDVKLNDVPVLCDNKGAIDVNVTEHHMAWSGMDLKMAKLVMSSPIHLTSGIEDAFSSNFPDFIPASPDYVPALPGKTYSSSLNPFGVVLMVSPTLSLFHDDPYMKVMQAFYTENSPIPPPTIIPPTSMLNPQEFFLPEGLLPPKKRGCDRSSSSTSALP
ncbi:retrovirus-related pol polyprotein from transposon TNT 1-94 [Tanacetum coccineum]